MSLSILNPDTTVYIFDYLFKCRIPNLQSMSVNYIKHFGMPTTGNSSIDKNLNSQLITTMLPISKMVEYFKDDVPVYIVSSADIKLIYEYISNHLHLWKKQLEIGLNLGDVPIDDLIAMDKFANVVYDHAKFQFTQEIVDSLLIKHMSNTIRVNRNNFFKTKPETSTGDGTDKNSITKINSNNEEIYPTRESLTDLFKDRKIGFKSWK